MQRGRSFLIAGLAAASLAANSTAFACRLLTPSGSAGVTNIRSGPTLDADVVDELLSHHAGNRHGRLEWCGDWKYDTNGHTGDKDGEVIRWLKVRYYVDSDIRPHWGWISWNVAGVPRL